MTTIKFTAKQITRTKNKKTGTEARSAVLIAKGDVATTAIEGATFSVKAIARLELDFGSAVVEPPLRHGRKYIVTISPAE